jgi:predicted SAM-dependent methyltransferase
VVLRRANIGAGSILPEDWDNFDSAWYSEEDDHPWGLWDVKKPLMRGARLAFRGSIGEYNPGPTHDWEMVGKEVIYPPVVDHYDYAVCSFMLQELNHHEIPGALENMMAILKPGGTLRILVPNIVNAIYAYQHKEEDWFPQDERTGGLDAKFCTMLTWYGTVRSVFTREYLYELADPHGDVFGAPYGETFTGDSTITELDSRPKEALIVEITKL